MFNYNELLHYQIFDDISNFSKYIVIYLIEPIIQTATIIKPEPSITQPTIKQTEP